MTVDTRRELIISTPEALKAIADPTRTAILQVLDDRRASAKELSEWLSMTHGRIGHHLKVLEANGLVEVVATRPVSPDREVLRNNLHSYANRHVGWD